MSEAEKASPPEPSEGERPARKFIRVMAALFTLIALAALARREWFDAAFFLLFGFFFLIEEGVVRLPKPARRLVVAAFVLLAVVRLFKLINNLSELG